MKIYPREAGLQRGWDKREIPLEIIWPKCQNWQIRQIPIYREASQLPILMFLLLFVLPGTYLAIRVPGFSIDCRIFFADLLLWYTNEHCFKNTFACLKLTSDLMLKHSFTYLSTPLTVPRDYPLFIEVAVCDRCACVPAFYWKCAKVIEEKMICAGPRQHLQSLKSVSGENHLLPLEVFTK